MPFFRVGPPKFEHESNAAVCKAQVRLELLLVIGVNYVDRFDFYDDATLDDQVGLIRSSDSYAFVDERHGALLLTLKAGALEFDDQTLAIRRLQKPGAQDAMDFDGSSDDCGR